MLCSLTLASRGVRHGKIDVAANPSNHTEVAGRALLSSVGMRSPAFRHGSDGVFVMVFYDAGMDHGEVDVAVNPSA